MELKQLRFHTASRKPFEGEEPVIAAVKRAQKDIATINGVIKGSALFRITAHVMANPSVVPHAVDIVRGGVEQAIARNNVTVEGIETAVQELIGQQVSLARQVRAPGAGLEGFGEKVRSGIGEAQSKIAASLARLNA